MGQEQRRMLLPAAFKLLLSVTFLLNHLDFMLTLQAEKAAFDEEEKKKEAEVKSFFISSGEKFHMFFGHV